MTKIPHLAGAEVVKALQRAGFGLIRTTGSHHIMRGNGKTFPVPMHGRRELGPGLLRAICRQAGITVEELMANL